MTTSDSYLNSMGQ